MKDWSNRMREHHLVVAALSLCVGGAVIFYVFAYRYYGTFIRGYDAQEYYTQLRSAVIDGDLDYNNEMRELTPGREKVFYDKDGHFIVPITPGGRPMNLGTVGWAIITLPAFMLAHGIAYLGGFPADGYSLPYVILCSLWNALLALVGLGGLAFVMQRLSNDLSAAFAITATFFATNLCYYTSVYPIMTHAASFGTVSLLIVLAYRLYSEATRWQLWMLAGFIAMFVVLLRPPNAVMLVVLAPAIRSLYVTDRAYVRRRPVLYFAPCLVVIGVAAAIGIQAVVWRLSYGYWIVNSYAESGQGFLWLHPNLWQILCSTQQGVWYIHPFYALGTLGLALGIRAGQNPYRSLWLAIISAVILHWYVNAAWFKWTSGHSFGNRRFVDVLPLIALGGSFGLCRWMNRRWKRISSYIVIGFLCLWNLGLFIGTIKGFLPIAPVELSPAAIVRAQWQTVKFLAEALL